MKNFILILFLSTFLLGGRTDVPDFPAPERLVTEIEITCSEGTPARQHFSDQDSMAPILQYLRSVAFVPEEAGEESWTEPCYTITLTHSTGRVTVYRQIGSRYLSKNGGRWHTLDPAQGQMLFDLYRGSI